MRVPPHNIEAEMSVLGCMLLGDPLAPGEAAEILTPDDFYRDGHQEIFAAMLDLLTDDAPLDPITVKDRLTARGTLDSIGGMGYLIQLGETMFTAEYTKHYAGMVKECAMRRRLIETAGMVAARAYGETGEEVTDVACQIEDAQRALFTLSDMSATTEGPKPAAEPMNRFLTDLFDRKESGGGFRGTPTGFTDLDRMLNGLRPANLYVLAARPSMGKTAMSCSILMNIARALMPVLFFSLEMPAEDVMMRLLSGEAGINSDRLQLADFADDATPLLKDCGRFINSLPFVIDDESDLTAAQIEARTRRVLSEKKTLGLVVVDYLQIMGTTQRHENRNVEVGMAAKSLKAMAKRLSLPVMVLSQLSRANEKRPDKTPVMSDLRESGDIEAVADSVIFLHRPSYYDPNAEPVVEGAYDKAEIHIPKSRNGRTGKFNLGFSPHFTRFKTLAPDYYREGF